MPIPNDPVVAAETRAAKEIAQKAEQTSLCDRPDEWMDEMIQRLFLETSKQLKSLENTKACDVREQDQHARTLASLERTLERLSRMQSQRGSRESKVAMTDDELRAAIKRELDQLTAPRSKGEVA